MGHIVLTQGKGDRVPLAYATKGCDPSNRTLQTIGRDIVCRDSEGEESALILEINTGIDLPAWKEGIQL